MSAEQHTEIVDCYLAKECRLGRVTGLWEVTQLPDVHISRFGVTHQQGEWRLVVDLSHPVGGIVNDGIEADVSPVWHVMYHLDQSRVHIT